MNYTHIAYDVILGGVLLLSSAASAGTVTGTVQHRKGNVGMVITVVVPGASSTPKATSPTINQKEMRFEPSLLVIPKGTTVNFKNSDPVNHNVFSPDGDAYNLGTWPQGESRPHTFDEVGAFVQLCSLHPEMEGYIVVVDTPYYGITDANGHFSIEGVPGGHYDVRVWGKKLKKSERKEVFAVDVVNDKGSMAISWDD